MTQKSQKTETSKIKSESVKTNGKVRPGCAGDLESVATSTPQVRSCVPHDLSSAAGLHKMAPKLPPKALWGNNRVNSKEINDDSGGDGDRGSRDCPCGDATGNPDPGGPPDEMRTVVGLPGAVGFPPVPLPSPPGQPGSPVPEPPRGLRPRLPAAPLPVAVFIQPPSKPPSDAEGDDGGADGGGGGRRRRGAIKVCCVVLGAWTAELATFPLDLVKTRQQIQGYKRSSSISLLLFMETVP